jgi:RNA polymerase sigma factor (sigma-70 family)
VSHARRAAVPGSDARSDGRLLAAFLATRDPEAFAELVARHGPMVFAVCRRLTGHHQDAEDAFQAVFVVLARKASAVVPREAVGNWLYGVAVRVAREARAVSARRRARETPAARLPDVARPGPEPDDLGAVLHEELAELPDKLRSLLVLCDLEGQPQTEVAGRLGLPVGTVYSRLAAARKALAARLKGRGVALSAAALTAALGQAGRAAVPAGLGPRTVAAAVSPNPLPAALAALSHGVLRTMLLQKLKVAAAGALLLAAGLFACGLLYAAPRAPTGPDPTPVAVALPQSAPKAAPKPLPTGPNKLLIGRNGELVMIDPDGKNDLKVSGGGGKFHRLDARLSPDGKKLAILIQAGVRALGTDAQSAVLKLHVRGLNEQDPGTDLEVECQTFAWSPDGSEIAFSEFDGFVDGPNRMSASHGVVNLETKAKTALPLPEDHVITDWSRDGRLFVTTRVGQDKEKPWARIYLMNRDGTEHEALTDPGQNALYGHISPDGKQVLYHDMTPAAKRQADGWRNPFVLEIATGKVLPVTGVPLSSDVGGYCWSPDGKRIAYTWREIHEGQPEDVIDKETKSVLVVCDPDGKNAKMIATEQGQGQWVITIGSIDWR